MNNKYKFICILILQTIIAYLGTIYIVNDGIRIQVLLDVDIYLFLLIWVALFYVFSHFIFPIKKIYQTIYEKRFYIATILLIIIVLGKFNGSSYGLWDNYVEPNYRVDELSPIFGHSQEIRSDEWLVNSSYTISQSETGYNYFNPVMRGTSTDVFATIPAPIKDILVIAKPFTIGYLLFGKDYGLSLYWFGRLFALFLVTFELLMLLTKGKKLSSLIGTILITFSPPVFWWYSSTLVEILVGGEFTIVMFYYFLKTNNQKKKILYSVLMAVGFISYVFALYPAWLISFGYFYLLLAIYFFITLRKEHKFKIRNLWPLLIAISIIGLFVVYFLLKSGDTFKALMSTVYPGKRFIVGGVEYENLFSYPIAWLFQITDNINPCELSTMYSFFPLIFFVAIYYLIKERKGYKKNGLIIMITSLIGIYLIFSFVSFPKFLAKITMLYMVQTNRLTVVISFLCIILLSLLIEKVKFETIKEKILLIVMILISSLITIFFAKKLINMSTLKLVISSIILLGSSCILLLRKNRTLILCIVVAIISIGTVGYINPIMKGFSGLDKKPMTKELKKYKKENATWVALDSFIVPNYLGMNGLKTINSTNVYPNLKLWKKIDKNKKNEDIYNRYAHISIKLTNKKTDFELLQGDYFNINLNSKDLCKLDVDYVTSYKELDKYENEEITFDKKYHKDNLYIFKVNCLGG